jgi:hypothetical protein
MPAAFFAKPFPQHSLGNRESFSAIASSKLHNAERGVRLDVDVVAVEPANAVPMRLPFVRVSFSPSTRRGILIRLAAAPVRKMGFPGRQQRSQQANESGGGFRFPLVLRLRVRGLAERPPASIG